MTIDVKALVDAAEEDGLMWALVVEHENGTREVHTWERHAIALLTPRALEPIREYLLSDEDVPCHEAVAAGLDVLNDCERCIDVPLPGEQAE